MSSWKLRLLANKPRLRNPIFIEGLPGIGNVGKVAVDFLIDQLDAVKLYDIFSYTFPHSVFVNEDNLVELPSITLYYKKLKKHDLLLLAGDVQPVDEISSYEFSEKMLDIAEKFDCKEIITLGGIGLHNVPKNPKVFCTGNNKRIINRYQNGFKVDYHLYGVVGPIIGVSGLLLGLAKKRNIDAISFLAETYSHPLYLGVKGSKEILRILNRKLDLKIDLKKLKIEIDEIEFDMVKKSKELSEVSKHAALKKLKSKFGGDVDYIG